MVQLYLNGKRKCDVVRECDIPASALNIWIKRSLTTASFHEKDNRTSEENELIILRKENQKLRMGNDILKQAADLRAKVNVIKNNCHKYSLSALCNVLQVLRSTYYYESTQEIDESPLDAKIIDIFKVSRNKYGTTKIIVELGKVGYQISRRRIGRIMKQVGLISNYTIAQFKPHIDKCNK